MKGLDDFPTSQGLRQFIAFFIFDGSLAVLIRKAILWQKIRQVWVYLLNLLLCQGRGKTVASPPMQLIKGIPYGVAMALGMGMLLVTGAGSG